MGTAFAGDKVERVALITNVGKDTLKISEVKAQCGCTATLMSEKELAPGDTGRLSISFNTEGRSGVASKQVYIMSNDDANPKTTITFTADVKSVLDIAPPSLQFNQSKVDAAETKTVTITNPSTTEAVTILSVKSDLDIVSLDLMKNKLMPGEQTQLQATINPKKSGTLNGKIELVTDNKHREKFEIRLYAWVTRN
jgi:hypothetical protein